MTDYTTADNTTTDNTNQPSILASTLWSGIQSLADLVADLVGVTAPLYEIYLDDALEYKSSMEQLEPILVCY